MNRLKTDESYYRNLVNRRIKSGKTVKEFCEHEGIAEWRYYNWRKRLENNQVSTDIQVDKTFLPVSVQTDSYPFSPHEKIDISFRDGTTVHLPQNFNETDLSTLCSVLRSN